MNVVLRQCNLFLLALSFFSRLPVARYCDYDSVSFEQANRYFGAVGWLLGALVALSYYGFEPFLPSNVCLFLAMVVSVLLTGAFHEDGLADMCDGLGGAFEKSRKLEIMKDSRLGTYGACALVAALGGKYILLSALNAPILAILVAYPLSRVVAASLIFDMQYIADSNLSKSKPITTQQSPLDLTILLASGALALLLLPLEQAAYLALLLVSFRFLFKQFLLKQLGGYTGDCLGGAQQLAELLVYLTLVVLWSN